MQAFWGNSRADFAFIFAVLCYVNSAGWDGICSPADAGDNIQIESADQIGTIIQGMATDPDGDTLEYRWLVAQLVVLFVGTGYIYHAVAVIDWHSRRAF